MPVAAKKQDEGSAFSRASSMKPTKAKPKKNIK